jgi:CO/xanthine dehydrogenase FAD-binding subunit
MSLDNTRFSAPETLDEVLAIRQQYPEAVILAGGTDLWPQWSSGEAAPERVVSLHHLGGLRRITAEDDFLRVGATCTHTELVRHDAVRRLCPALSQAAATVGALQIQNRGTIGGNVVNASPAADLPPVLVAVGAVLEFSSAKGSRQVAVDHFYRGYRDVDLRPGELLTSILIPPLPVEAREHFKKVGTRRAQAISKVVGACRLELADDGTIVRAGVAFGSVGPTVVRANELEKWLVGQQPNIPTAVQATRMAREAVSPIDDLRSSAEYRKHICGIMVRNWLLDQ